MSNIAGFHYKGKDKRGVSQWRGSGNWAPMLHALSIGFIIYGVCAGIVFCALLLYALFTLSWPAVFNVFLLVSGIHTLAFGGSGVWMRSMVRHIRSLDSVDKLSARFGVNEEILAEVAQDKGIKPRMSINGMDYYNPADFAEDALTLLRGTTRPNETQEVLLRPAVADTQTAPEQLLRVPNGAAQPAPAVASTPLTTLYLSSQTSGEATTQELRAQ